MRFSRPRQAAPLLFLTTVVALSFRPLSTTQADNDSSGIQFSRQQQRNKSKTLEEDCPYFGCSLLPHDVHYGDGEIKQALEKIRSLKRDDADPEALEILRQCATPDSSAVTLTLIGYKGGQLQEQINQDRAMVIKPYFISEDQRKETTSNKVIQQERILLGVFDGHAPLGELVSEYTVSELPKLLASKLEDALADCPEDDIQTEMDLTTRVLTETFVQLDQTAPADPSGGCTATVVLCQGKKIYIANVGDSRSFIVAYRPSTGLSEIMYMSREDKPDLADEKARVQAAGGQVYIPARGTSRVVYHDPKTGAPTGLAMSRSIGDWAAGKMGVIAEPIVHCVDIDTLVSTQLGIDAVSMDAQGNVEIGGDGDIEDDVYIYAVSATDGMMDYLHEGEIAKILSHALYGDAGVHPVSACEHLVFAAAQGWQQAKQGRYRDDIAIAVSAVRRPPTPREPPTQ